MMKNWVVWIENTEGYVFYLVKGNQWTDSMANAGRFTRRGAARLQNMHANLCLGAPDPNGDSEIYECGAKAEK